MKSEESLLDTVCPLKKSTMILLLKTAKIFQCVSEN